MSRGVGAQVWMSLRAGPCAATGEAAGLGVAAPCESEGTFELNGELGVPWAALWIAKTLCRLGCELAACKTLGIGSGSLKLTRPGVL